VFVVHSAAPEAATEKAVELVKMSIARARTLWPLEGGTLAVDQTGIVIGGGLSGMTAALALANQGFSVHLVEQTAVWAGPCTIFITPSSTTTSRLHPRPH